MKSQHQITNNWDRLTDELRKVTTEINDLRSESSIVDVDSILYLLDEAHFKMRRFYGDPE